MNKEPYVYSPLDRQPGVNQIRLVRLLPSHEFASDLRCAIFNVSLNEPPPYEALSYTWGELTSPKMIYIDDQKHNVTTNLELAFRHLRLKDSERTLWADALCINQQDLTEKSSQVQMMRSIYLKAQQVVVWLGEEGDASHALAVCRRWRDAGTRPEGIDDPEFKVYDAHAVTKKDHEACEALFGRPWWSRTWILQEVIHDNPARVRIGLLQLDLDELIEFYLIYRNAILFSSDFIWRKVFLVPRDERVGYPPEQETWDGFVEGFELGFNNIKNIGFFRSSFERKKETSPSDLESLFHFFRHQLATDPRDKVFAFLGMVKQRHEATIIRADYHASKRTVYINAARSLLGQPLRFVESPDRPVASGGEFPSWVPDFTTRRQAISTIMNTISFHADSGLPDFVYLQANRFLRNPAPNEGDYLRLIGIYIGVITGVIVTHVSRHLSKMDDDRVKLFKYDTNLTKRDEAIYTEPWPQSHGQINISNTSWGPLWAEVGDIIIVAVGNPEPLVLRKTGDHYLFVGICWLIDSQIPSPDELRGVTGSKGFSPVMFGSAFQELGKTTFVEELLLH